MTVPKPRLLSNAVRAGLGSALLSLLVGGCSQPLYNGPSFLNSRSTEVDRVRYQRFDPLPDETLAPDTFSRPRGYDLQRTRARQAAESRMLPIQTLPAPDGLSANPYDGVVRD